MPLPQLTMWSSRRASATPQSQPNQMPDDTTKFTGPTIPGYTGYRPGYHEAIGKRRTDSFNSDQQPLNDIKNPVCTTSSGALGDLRASSWETMNSTMYKGTPWSNPAGRASDSPDGYQWFDALSASERQVVYSEAYRKVGGSVAVQRMEEDVRSKLLQRTRGGAFRLRKAFKLFDRDGSGDMDPGEFQRALEWFGVGSVTEDQVLSFFGIYDHECTGALGYYEFISQILGEDFVGFKEEPKKNTHKRWRHVCETPRDSTLTSRTASSGSTDRSGDLDEQGALQDLHRNLTYLYQCELDEAVSFMRARGLYTAHAGHARELQQIMQRQNGKVSIEQLCAWWYVVSADDSPMPSAPIRPQRPTRPARQPLTTIEMNIPAPPSQPRCSARNRPGSALTREKARGAAQHYKLGRPLSERNVRKAH